MKKWPILFVVMCLALLGQDRQFHNKRSVLCITPHAFAWGVEQNGSTHIRKIVATKNKILTISADEMRYDHETEEIELHGNVRVKLN